MTQENQTENKDQTLQYHESTFIFSPNSSKNHLFNIFFSAVLL